MLDLSTITHLDLPYENLILTGFLGVGKSAVGQYISRSLSLDLVDIDEEIELQELMSIGKIRELYGDSRLRALEYEFCRHASLKRRAVIVVPGAALLEARTYSILNQSGKIVVLTCDLGEALRRMHLSSEQRYRDATLRRRMMSRLRREYEIVNDERLIQLDTTQLSIEEESNLLVDYWMTGEPEGEYFRYGPPPRIEPPEKPVVTVDARMQSQKADRVS